MSEKDLDSSKNPYLKKNESKNNIKQVNWDMAIGLQEVDNLKPSKYLEQIREKCFRRTDYRRSRTKFKSILC